MLKTPPRLAMLGIAVTIAAIGAGNALAAPQVAEVPDSLLEEFQPFFSNDVQVELQGLDADLEITFARDGAKLQRAC